jgi:hypothetical protein
MKYFFSLLVIALCVVSCNETAQKEQPQYAASQPAQITESLEVKDKRAVKNAVYQWNVATNRWDTATLRTLIAPSVSMYAHKMTAEQAAKFLYKRFTLYSHYSQRVTKDFVITSISPIEMKASFVRLIDWGQKETELSTSLRFKKIEDKWLIVEENEEKNSLTAAIKEEKKEILHFSSCEDLAKSVIKSSSVYKSFVKNNSDIELQLNTSPTSFIHPQKKANEYEFVLKAVNTRPVRQVFFVVYTEKAQLTAYNVADKKEQKIPFEEKFVPYFHDACK